MTRPRISVVIPTFNRAEMACDCVASVLATGYPDLEVFVVDDCSPDDTGARIAVRFGGDARVKYLRNERNSFQAVSRNRGFRASSGEYVFVLDDDNLVDRAIFVELLACFGRHPDAGLVAPLAVHRRPGKEGLVWTLGSGFSRWTSRPADRGGNTSLDALPVGAVDFPTTYSPNAFMVPRRVYEELGGMEESFVQIFEESDFGWRVCESGRTGWIAARARTDHLGFLEPGCVPALRMLGIEKPYRTYCFARNRLRFSRRHFNFLQVLSVTLVFAPLSVLYYGCVALRNRRPDIAWAYLKGTVAGMLGL
ncbi:MAG: glycosyltransferase family 2 protein [Kiritimatiellae bacterium]|nr:glycosyltransferase family 2 protein [Kiritimatiellia bacterium]